jgi:hypothetical protein
MGDFCSENKETITDANYSVSFGAASTSNKSSLPSAGSGFSSSTIDPATGLVKQDEIDRWITTLLSTSNARAPDGIGDMTTETDPASAFATSAATLRASISKEYCYYYVRYMYALQKVLLLAATSGMQLASNADYNAKKSIAVSLNGKLNQLLQIMQGIVGSRATSLKEYYGATEGVNEVNEELDTARASLVKHMSALQNNNLQSDIRSSMIDYSLEKNSSSTNLLAIYGFMNIVAVGMLYYLYRNSKA